MNITLNQPRGIPDWLNMYCLYRMSFPPAERKPFRFIRKMYKRGKTDIWCIRRDGQFAGFASTVNGSDLILLDYLAVNKRCRGTGIGAAAMKLLLEKYREKGFFVEIETTKEDCPDLALRQKRRRFYEAAGLTDLGTSVRVFSVKMDLLGVRCTLDFEDYREFYRFNYSPWAAEHLKPLDEKE